MRITGYQTKRHSSFICHISKSRYCTPRLFKNTLKLSLNIQVFRFEPRENPSRPRRTYTLHRLAFSLSQTQVFLVFCDSANHQSHCVAYIYIQSFEIRISSDFFNVPRDYGYPSSICPSCQPSSTSEWKHLGQFQILLWKRSRLQSMQAGLQAAEGLFRINRREEKKKTGSQLESQQLNRQRTRWSIFSTNSKVKAADISAVAGVQGKILGWPT